MGLDIYLYRYENFEETRRKEDLYSEESEKIWGEAGDYDSLSDEQKEEIRNKCKQYALSLGLNEDGDDQTTSQRVETDHPDYPDHYFKIGYFRSSYNEGGIERILGDLGLPNMSSIFDVESEEYYIKPNWEKALAKVESVIKKFKEKGPYRVKTVYPEKFGVECPTSAGEALKIFEGELEKHKGKGDYNYSNSKGEFSFHQPEKVLAMIPGKNRYIFNIQPCIFVVTESDNTWYLQALEIIRETCLFVLNKEDKEKYYLHWSG